jgi:hypothetical protein
MSESRIRNYWQPLIGFISIGVFVLCSLLVACRSNNNIELARQAVVQFHAQLDSEQYSILYAGADKKFHNFTSETDFAKLLEMVHRKLGTVEQSNLRNTEVAWFAGQGATVTLVYDTSFAAGSGTEQFVWHISDNRATLYSYRINSKDLSVK